MKGFRILAQHMPDIRGWRILILVVIGTLSFLIPWWIMQAVANAAPLWSGLLQLGFLVGTYFWLRQYFRRKKANFECWGERAYQRAFIQYILVGLFILFAVIVHINYLPGERIVKGWASFPVEILAWYLLITGSILDIRAIFTMGFDSLALLYVYFPEKGRLVNSSIYKMIRHPVYSALIRIGLALGLWRGTLLSILFGLFLAPAFLFFWLRGVEEPDLIERFGDGYRVYRLNTPAFWPRFGDLGKFWRYLLLGDWNPVLRAS